jgi:hypothetical protein
LSQHTPTLRTYKTLRRGLTVLAAAAWLVASWGQYSVLAAASLPVTSSAGQPSSLWHNSTPGTFSDSTYSTEAARHRYVVINYWETDKLHKLKAANPNLAVFAYKDASSVRVGECGTTTEAAGLDYCDTNTNHPDWFLTYADGTRMSMNGYNTQYQTDIGNPAYQQAWATKVSNDVKTAGFDGVFIDNIITHCDSYYTACPAKYPTNAAFQQAYVSFLAGVRGTLQTAGLKELGNLTDARQFPGLWNSYMTNLDGGFDEWWIEFSLNSQLGGTDWKTQVDEIANNETAGKFTGVQAHDAGNVSMFRYAFASYMLANGGSSSMVECDQTTGDDCYSKVPLYKSEYDYNLGAAQGSYYASGNGYRRDFACGVAVVNPSGSSVHFDFGKTMVDEDGVNRSSIDLAANKGMVLRTLTCGTTPPPPVCTTTTSTTNLALGRTVTTSSVQPLRNTLIGCRVVDGSNTFNVTDPTQDSRWESASSDPQWLTVDLGATKSFSGISINWAQSSAKNYTVQTSTNNSSWKTITTVTNNGTGSTSSNPTSGLKTYSYNRNNTSGRYIRVYGTARTTANGYSIVELTVKP